MFFVVITYLGGRDVAMASGGGQQRARHSDLEPTTDKQSKLYHPALKCQKIANHI